MKRSLFHLLACTSLAAVLASAANAHDSGLPHGQAEAAAAVEKAATDVPLFENLGSHSYPVTTANPLAQAYFDQGLRWAWAFNHAEAQRAFQTAQKLDPTCAMCFWGEAYVLGPNINAGMGPEAAAKAAEAAAKARRLAEHVSSREKDLIDALAKRYSADSSADQSALNQSYAAAMAKVVERNPQDDEIATLYADALMNLMPWDYWLDGGATPRPDTIRLVASLERVLARNPDHVGAIHLYIHAVEASMAPETAEPFADRLAALMPGAGHIVHMPSHIYHKVGRWVDSLEINRKAVAADEAYFERVGVQPETTPGVYTDGYYPHNLHFLMTSAQMAGDVEAIAEATKKLDSLVSNAMASKVGGLQPIKAASYFAHAQYSDPKVILALPAPANALPYVEATWRYARGIAFAATGANDAAGAEIAAIRKLATETDFSVEMAGGLPAPDLLELGALIVEARIAQHQGNLTESRSKLEAAVAIEDGLAYMEPAYWYYPVRQTLGAVYMAMGEHEAAVAAFEHVLEQTPNNAWALWGLREVFRRTGRAADAEEMDARFKAAWVGAPDFLGIELL
ncbi:tetratricopeptide repeat protein [Mesorhizobium sp. WSM2239]|uniref:Tetratricopeptide repeat protein n=2 Tax=unclassified Mesorhizobium TaxID=325217 RepID=A0AAU8DHH1_9HYPH